MAYTVKQLSELSGVTIRTLHFYEELDLLKPTYYGSNGYRYYESNELIQLQQILVLKELGFSLKKIQKILNRNDLTLLQALCSHKAALKREWEKIGKQIKTIEKTIKHVKGKKQMKDQEIFEGFNVWAKGKGKESYFIGHCVDPDSCNDPNEALVLKNARRSEKQSHDQSFYEEIEKTGNEIYGDLASCIEEGLESRADKVQVIIRKHYLFATQFLNATKEVYSALAELYQTHHAYRDQLEAFHKELPSFISDGMKVYAKTKLK